MSVPRDVNAERAMHLRRALEDIRDCLQSYQDGFLSEAYSVALDALHDDDVTIAIAEQDAADSDPEPS